MDNEDRAPPKNLDEAIHEMDRTPNSGIAISGPGIVTVPHAWG